MRRNRGKTSAVSPGCAETDPRSAWPRNDGRRVSTTVTASPTNVPGDSWARGIGSPRLRAYVNSTVATPVPGDGGLSLFLANVWPDACPAERSQAAAPSAAGALPLAAQGERNAERSGEPQELSSRRSGHAPRSHSAARRADGTGVRERPLCENARSTTNFHPDSAGQAGHNRFNRPVGPLQRVILCSLLRDAKHLDPFVKAGLILEAKRRRQIDTCCRKYGP